MAPQDPALPPPWRLEPRRSEALPSAVCEIVAMMRLLCALIPLAHALRATGPLEETPLNLEDFPELCDQEIVEDSCRLLNEGEKHDNVEKFTTWQAWKKSVMQAD